MNDTVTETSPANAPELTNHSRRDMFRLAGAGFASAALAASGMAAAQVPEEANTEALLIERKGINKDISVF